MAINLQALLLIVILKVLQEGLKSIRWASKGSSTVQLYFQDCKVPVENVLGEIGKGHLIAFNILNIGRLKLCAATIQGAKTALEYVSSICNNKRTV